MRWREVQTLAARQASHEYKTNDGRLNYMGHQAVRRTIAIVGLVVVVVACGTANPANSGPPDSSSNPSSAPTVAAATGAAPSPTAAPTPAPVVVAAATLEPALKQLWQVGGPKPPRFGGCCLAVAPDGNIWVAAGFDSTFWIIDANGKYLESWGKGGDGDGEFNFVEKTDNYGAVAFDPDGTFYVADTGNHRVQKFDKDRKFVKAWGEFGADDGQLVSPMDIASDGRGHVFVVDNDRQDVQEFSSDGEYLRTLVTDLRNYFIEMAEGRLYVDNGPVILVFDTDGKQLPGIDLSATGWYAGGMAFDAAGNMYVPLITTYGPGKIETKAVYELDASGKLVNAWPGLADTLALAPDGSALYSSFYVDPFIRKLALPAP
jgi:hypothetical protein